MASNEPSGKDTEPPRVMIGLRYPEVGVEELKKIQEAKKHPHFSDTLAEALDEYRDKYREAA